MVEVPAVGGYTLGLRTGGLAEDFHPGLEAGIRLRGEESPAEET
jgi:hypothetical protein